MKNPASLPEKSSVCRMTLPTILLDITSTTFEMPSSSALRKMSAIGLKIFILKRKYPMKKPNDLTRLKNDASAPTH